MLPPSMFVMLTSIGMNFCWVLSILFCGFLLSFNIGSLSLYKNWNVDGNDGLLVSSSPIIVMLWDPSLILDENWLEILIFMSSIRCGLQSMILFLSISRHCLMSVSLLVNEEKYVSKHEKNAVSYTHLTLPTN